MTSYIGRGPARLVRKLFMSSIAGRRAHLPPELGIGGVRPAQQDLYELISQAKPVLYSSEMWNRLGDHSPYSDLDITNDNITRWHPLNQSLYVGYKLMLAGLLMISKGDRIAMNASVETRYPFLDDDVISFCAGIAPEYKLRRNDREMALAQVARGSCRRGSPTAQRRCFVPACPARSWVPTDPRGSISY